MVACWLCLHGTIDALKIAEHLVEDHEDYPDNTSVNFQIAFACPALLTAKVQSSVF